MFTPQDSPAQPGRMMFNKLTTMAYRTDNIVTERKMNPPALLPEYLPACNVARSSFVLGNNFTNKSPAVCKPVVKIVSLIIPETSPDTMVSLLTSHIPSNNVDTAEASPMAQLFTVVNIA